MNFKTPQWGVLKEGKPCKRGLPLLRKVLVILRGLPRTVRNFFQPLYYKSLQRLNTRRSVLSGDIKIPEQGCGLYGVQAAVKTAAAAHQLAFYISAFGSELQIYARIFGKPYVYPAAFRFKAARVYKSVVAAKNVAVYGTGGNLFGGAAYGYIAASGAKLGIIGKGARKGYASAAAVKVKFAEFVFEDSTFAKIDKVNESSCTNFR